MSLKCERCGKIDWGSTARVYFMQGAAVVEVCTKCEDEFKDLDWPAAMLEQMDLAAFRHARLKDSPDADEARLLEIIRAARVVQNEARVKVKEWLRAGVTALLLALALTTPAHADVIAGGPRQQLDAAHCAVYKPVWHAVLLETPTCGGVPS